jgi:hypothetical protein
LAGFSPGLLFDPGGAVPGVRVLYHRDHAETDLAGIAHLKTLVGFLKSNLAPITRKLRPLVENGITSDLLPSIFLPFPSCPWSLLSCDSLCVLFLIQLGQGTTVSLCTAAIWSMTTDPLEKWRRYLKFQSFMGSKKNRQTRLGGKNHLGYHNHLSYHSQPGAKTYRGLGQGLRRDS